MNKIYTAYNRNPATPPVNYCELLTPPGTALLADVASALLCSYLSTCDNVDSFTILPLIGF